MKYIISLSIIIIFTSCQMILYPSAWVQEESDPTIKYNTKISDNDIFWPVQPILADSILVTATRDRITFTNIFTDETINVIESKTEGYIVRYTGNGYNIPTILNNKTIYHQDSKGVLMAIDAKTGDIKWISKGIGRWVKEPIFENGIIYIASSYGLISLSEKTGEKRWSIKKSNWNFIIPEIISHNTDYIIAYESNKMLFSIAKEDGKINWMKEMKVNSAITSDSTVICTTNNKLIYFNMMSGEEESSTRFKYNLMLLNYNNKTYGVSSNGSVFSIKNSQVEKLYEDKYAYTSVISISENSIVIQGSSTFGRIELFSFDLDRNKLEWERRISRPLVIKPIYKDDYIFITTQMEGIVKMNRFNGEIISTYNNESINKGDSIDTDGIIFMSIKDGKLNILKK